MVLSVTGLSTRGQKDAVGDMAYVLYPAGEEPGVSAAVLKILGRESVLESTSILGVRGSSTSCSNDDEDAGCDKSGGDKSGGDRSGGDRSGD